MSDYCCGPWWRNPWCLLDRWHHRLVLRLHREIPGLGWICDLHESSITGFSVVEVRRERQERDQ